jgi:hypothetical protein
MKVASNSKQEYIQNAYIQSYDASGLTQLSISYSQVIEMYVLNLYMQYNETYGIQIQSQSDSSSSDDSLSSSDDSSSLGVISLVLFIILGIFISICVVAIVRICIRKRLLAQNMVLI